ncbi:MAG TPA: hypothetical protein VKR53_09465 [Puia sp.]|nr:hypothetical protein [Puia sp.]
MKFFLIYLGFCLLFVFCDDNQSPTTGIGGDSTNPSVDSLGKSSSNKHLPSDTTNTMALGKNWNDEFVSYDLPVNARLIAWMQAGVGHLQNKKIAAIAQKTLADYENINRGIKNYLAAHRDLQTPEINTLGAVNIGDHYGQAWDHEWLRKIIGDQDSLLTMIDRSFPSVTDSVLSGTLQRTLPKIRSDLDRFKQWQ